MAPSLLNLPSELIINIAAYLTTPELCPLRQSCKWIEQTLFRSFAKEFFTKRSFMVEHESLEALVGIANHPRLATYLQEVIITTYAYRLEVTSDPRLARLLESRYVNGYLSRQTLLATGTAKMLLLEVFSKLPNLRVVGIRDFHGSMRRRDPVGTRWRPWGSSKVDSLMFAAPNGVFALVVSALCSAHSSAADLEVILRHSPITAEAFDIIGQPNAQQVLSRLRTVMLDLAPMFDHTNTPSSNMSAMERVLQHIPIERFLSMLTSLEHLRLNFRRRHNLVYEVLDWLAGCRIHTEQFENFVLPAPTFSNLRTLEIGMTNVEQHYLVNAIARFDLRSFSLWKLHLVKGHLDSNDVWAVFLSNLSRRLTSTCKMSSIMIGMVTQDIELQNGDRERYRPVTWVPKGTLAPQRATAPSQTTIKYDSKYTNETAIDWLTTMSKLIHVPSGLRPSNGSGTSFGGSDDDDADDDDPFMGILADIDDDEDDNEEEEEDEGEDDEEY